MTQPGPSRASAKTPLHTPIAELPVRLLFWGVVLILLGFSTYMLGIVFSVFRLVLQLGPWARVVNEDIVWWSGAPVTLGLLLCSIDLFVMLRHKRIRPRWVNGTEGGPIPNKVTVVLTAYNDEASIGEAVRDFREHPLVQRVIVVSNNSKDKTMERAEATGAIVFNELNPGYGHCVYRCLTEGLAHDDAEIIVLCEGDCTFRAFDIDKFLAYLPHAELVNGTRIVEQLRAYDTQLSTFMYYGNFFVGKLLEIKNLGRGTFTDVGTTYKAFRRNALIRLMPHLNPVDINLTFNAHLIDTALQLGLVTVECPVTFHPRVGVSKGGNVNNSRALKVGMSMMWGIAFGWKRKAQ